MLPGMPALAGGKGFFARHGLPIGLQLYTVGDAARTDIAGTLRKVAAAGYRTVELAGFHGHDARTLKSAADAAGIRFTSIHVQAQARGTEPGFDEDPAKLAADLHLLGIGEVVLPMFSLPAHLPKPAQGQHFSDYLAQAALLITVADWRGTADFLNTKAVLLRKEGLRVSYHNHNVEFAPAAGGGGLRGIDVLLAHTDPALVSFEMDVGWVAAAGVDPVPLLTARPHRFRMMHVKDLRADTRPNFALRMDSTEVGAGMLDWKQLLPLAYATGVRRFFVEQEPPFAKDRFQSIAQSCAYLRALA
ncbi:MAG TPA: sugar phosphate isomerase/epimerase [Steroidobacteraceae bacterium]|nr:sugar phosphate isomerase/epimerase [Steroidobacteraceae bacterium]